MSPDNDMTLEPSEFRDSLQAIYSELEAELARRGPVCRISGRCCRFQEYGHTLFLSAVEAALLLADAPAPARPLDEGATCPWQNAQGRCLAREARPLACRVYFCDPAFQDVAPQLSERFLGRIKELVSRLKLPWDYAPLHHHLRRAQVQGGWPPPNDTGSP
jgi:hypothetical protein